MGRYWYVFDPVSGNNAHDPANYTRLVDSTKPGCTTGSVICAIYAPAGNAFPTSPFTTRLNNYITAALASPHVPQPTSGKYFVYLKS